MIDSFAGVTTQFIILLINPFGLSCLFSLFPTQPSLPPALLQIHFHFKRVHVVISQINYITKTTRQIVCLGKELCLSTPTAIENIS